MTASATGPMAGTRVVDLTRILAGPLCSMMLGDMGAEVIKVEPPGTGDDTRGWGPPFAAGEAAYFLGVNRNKRSITLNMAAPAGQQVLRDLIAKADVLVDNFKLGTLDKWGFTDAWFDQNAPRLVRCSITGYGSSGPKAALPGYDFILQAESGLMSICGPEDGGPTKYGVAIVDVCTGMLACNSILAALNARARTGKGQKVEVSLYESSLAMLVNVASNVLVSGKGGGRFGNGHPSIVPYTTYQAADGMMALAVGNDNQFARTAELLGHPEWAKDERFAKNRARVENRAMIDALIEDALKNDKADNWLAKLEVRWRALRQDQFGRGCTCRSAHAGAQHGRNGGTSDHRRAQDNGHPVQVFRHRMRGAPRAADAGPAHGRGACGARPRCDGDREIASRQDHLREP